MKGSAIYGDLCRSRLIFKECSGCAIHLACYFLYSEVMGEDVYFSLYFEVEFNIERRCVAPEQLVHIYIQNIIVAAGHGYRLNIV